MSRPHVLAAALVTILAASPRVALAQSDSYYGGGGGEWYDSYDPWASYDASSYDTYAYDPYAYDPYAYAYDPYFYDPYAYAYDPWVYDPCTWCPSPTEAQCYEASEDPNGFWNTTCGQCEQKLSGDAWSTCNQIYQRNRDAELAGLEASTAPVPREIYDRTPWQAYDPARDYVDSQAVDTSASADMVASSTGPISTAPTFLSWMLDRNAWSANGNVIEECAEYVYERYYDVSLFEDEAYTTPTAYRAIFEKGYGVMSDGIADRSGRVVAQYQPPSPTLQPKNIYFTLQRPYPTGHAAPAWNDARLAIIDDPYEPHHPPHTLAWHRQMSDALEPDWSDATLDALRVKQIEFLQLVAERQAVYQRWTNWQQALLRAKLDCTMSTVPVDPGTLTDPWEDPSISPVDLPLDAMSAVLDGMALVETYSPDLFSTITTTVTDGAGSALTIAAPPAGLTVALSPQTGMLQLYSLTSSSAGSGEALAIPPERFFDWDGLPNVSSASCDDVSALLAATAQAAAAVASRLNDWDARLEQELIGAADQGCLDPALGPTGWTVPSACDWSPRMLLDESRSLLDDERTVSREHCLLYTGDRFDPNAPIQQATTVGGEQKMNDSAEEVDSFIALTRAWIDALELPRDPVTKKVMRGESSGDKDRLGNSTFGARYEYDVGWWLRDFVGVGSAACGASLSAGAKINAWVTAFGEEVEVFQAQATVETAPKHVATPPNSPKGPDQREFTRTVALRVLGVDVLAAAGDLLTEDQQKFQRDPNPSCIDGDGDGHGQGCNAGSDCNDSDPLHWNICSGAAGATVDLPRVAATFHRAWSKEASSPELVQTFVVAGVPITIRAWMVMKAGLEVNVAAQVIRFCPNVETSMVGTVKPFAELEAKVSGGVNIAIGEIGVQIDLTLLRVDLPFELSFSLGLIDGPGAAENSTVTTARLVAHPKLNMVLSTLKGQLQAYLRFPIPGVKPIYFKLFSWAGIVLADVPLIDEAWDLPIGALEIAFKAEGP